VVTAGIGQNPSQIRFRVCEAGKWLWIELDEGCNTGGGPRIGGKKSLVSAWLILTDEELMIAQHARSVIGFDGQPRASERAREKE